MPAKNRSRLHDLAAQRDARISWEQLEAADPEEWRRLPDSIQQELMRRAYEEELDR